MTNKQVAQAFAEGKTKGKSLHMFIEGNTIYSYGKHFPIARRILSNGDVYFTEKTYSSSTARHKSLVYSALTTLGQTPIMVHDINNIGAIISVNA